MKVHFYTILDAKVDLCKELAEKAAHQHKHVTSVWRFTDVMTSSNDSVSFMNDVTLMTHMSVDRLGTLAVLVTHWEGPIALSVYGDTQELLSFTSSIQQYPQILRRTNIALNIMLKHGVSLLDL